VVRRCISTMAAATTTLRKSTLQLTYCFFCMLNHQFHPEMISHKDSSRETASVFVCTTVDRDEDDALRQIRQFLSYMPQSVWEIPERVPTTDDPMRARAQW
jgi:hypothetical protein